MRTEVRTVYIASDGKEFNNKFECSGYEMAKLHELPDAEKARRRIQQMKANGSGTLPNDFKMYIRYQREMLQSLDEYMRRVSMACELKKLACSLNNYAYAKDMYERDLFELNHLRNVVKGKEEL